MTEEKKEAKTPEAAKKPVLKKKEEKKEIYILSSNPHVRNPDTVKAIMWRVFIALFPATLVGIYVFKIKALFVILISILSCIVTEAVLQKWLGHKLTIDDGTAALTGLLLALTITSEVPLWAPVIGGAVAIGIGKFAFGGLGHNIFNPAFIGRAFMVASWPAAMGNYKVVDAVTTATPLSYYLKTKMLAGQWDMAVVKQVFLGLNISGTIGETSALALLIGAAYLFATKVIDWRIPLSYIATVALIVPYFGHNPIFHIFAGGLIIGAFFMATDYVTSPTTKKGRIVFGVGCGVLTACIRLFGNLPEGVMFSILVMNSFTPLIDRFTAPKPFGFVEKKEEN